jgi:hypothetical protein
MRKSKKSIIPCTSRYPYLRDFRESARVLAFLQKFYMLNVTKLRDGEIQVQNDKENTYMSHSTLKSFDMSYIGIIALKNQWNNSGRAWIQFSNRVPCFFEKLSRSSLGHNDEVLINRSSSTEKITPTLEEFKLKEWSYG